MLEMLRDLAAHKDHANATLLTSIRLHDAAAVDKELRDLLHHIILANRFWVLTCSGQPFNLREEMRAPESLDELIGIYRRTQELEAPWIAQLTPAELSRELNNPIIAGTTCSVAQAMVQVCMHSLGHRAQCAKMLRRLGGEPPMTDFILWLTHRSPAQWPEVAI